jgi:4-amino-4-deoxy-L-arabinose transferase-like glycosyltransferase
VVFFSLSVDKLPGYVLPALPALAALAGIALAQTPPRRLLLPLTALTLALLPPAAVVLPAALDEGLADALEQARFLGAMLAVLGLVVALAAGAWAAERAAQRRMAVAAVVAAAAAGYAWMKVEVTRAAEQAPSARYLGRLARPYGEQVCVGSVPRQLEYGIYYYAGRKLEACSSEKAPPYRIESQGITRAEASSITP